MNKKERLIEAALSIFQEKGIEKTKISDIVKKAGVAQGTYYLYFSSKLSIMPSIAEVMVERTIDFVEQVVDKEADFATKIKQVVDAIFSMTNEYQEVHAIIYAGLASTEHIKEWEKVYEPFYNWISDLLLTGKQTGSVRKTIDEKATSKIIIGLIESAAEQIYLYDSQEEDYANKQKLEVVDFIYHALGVKN